MMSYPATVTLKQLREKEACVSGYNKVVCMLKGIKYEEKPNYIRFQHKEPILITDILNNNGFDDALWCARFLSDRDARLFAVWCARKVQHLMNDERSINALNVSENYANGLATDEELNTARAAVMDAAWDAAWDTARAAVMDAAWDAAWDTARAAVMDAARAAAWDTAMDAAMAAQKEMYIKVLNGEAEWQVK